MDDPKGIIRGKLDQQNQCLEVEQCRGRDVRPEKLANMITTLSQWCDRCQSVLVNLEQQIKSADEHKQQAVHEKKKVEDEFNNLKKTLKAAGSGSSATPDIDENIPGEVTSTRTGQEPERKKEKTRHKGLRGSSKIFTKHS